MQSMIMSELPPGHPWHESTWPTPSLACLTRLSRQPSQPNGGRKRQQNMLVGYIHGKDCLSSTAVRVSFPNNSLPFKLIKSTKTFFITTDNVKPSFF